MIASKKCGPLLYASGSSGDTLPSIGTFGCGPNVLLSHEVRNCSPVGKDCCIYKQACFLPNNVSWLWGNSTVHIYFYTRTPGQYLLMIDARGTRYRFGVHMT